MKHTTNHVSQKILVTLLASLLASGAANAADTDYIKVKDNGVLPVADGRHAVAIGIAASAADLSTVAVGTGASAKGTVATALGATSQADGVAAIALGSQSSALANAATALGRQASATAGSSTAVGSASQATAMAATAFGSGAEAAGMNSTALGQGAKALKANTTAIGTKAQATVDTATAIGSGAQATARFATAIGAAARADGMGSVAEGLRAHAVGSSSVAIGEAATANESHSVALGSNSVTAAAVGTNEATVNGISYSGFAGNTPVATVSVGKAGAERTITNVAAGRIDAASTDVINGSQLYLVADQVGKNVADIAAAKTELVAGDNVGITSVVGANNQTVYTVSANSSSTAAGSDYITVTPSTTTGANGASNTTYAVDLSEKTKAAIQNMANIDNRLDDMEDDLRAGIAGATAIAFLQRPNEAGKSIVSAAVGGFRDQQALAVGYARNSDNNKWSIKAGVGVNTQKDVNWGGSVGYQW